MAVRNTVRCGNESIQLTLLSLSHFLTRSVKEIAINITLKNNKQKNYATRIRDF